MENSLLLYSTIHPTLLKTTLIKGFSLAFTGVLMLLLAGIFLDPEKLKMIGFWIFLLAIGLIGWGLIPYRKLFRIAFKPDQIIVQNDRLDYYRNGIKKFEIPLSSILRWEHQESKNTCGIQVWLKAKPNNPLFFPFFSKRSFEELKNYNPL